MYSGDHLGWQELGAPGTPHGTWDWLAQNPTIKALTLGGLPSSKGDI